ncbi:hypothetical protein Salvo_10 [Xylella phage Salvo]|uniref:Uncharacterized protein n=1 Tax=Xylella phage Salvo TaxID=1415147 RepID=V5Q9T1_9CAUD|nr:hypothetical protein FGG49_gp10 [Xylella phage Salvo]AHB12210.1 hypothetical protein Salvo_10 [Xylella phage Salvo]
MKGTAQRAARAALTRPRRRHAGARQPRAARVENRA